MASSRPFLDDRGSALGSIASARSLPRAAFASSDLRNPPAKPDVERLMGRVLVRPDRRFVMKKLLLAAGAVGAMMLAASPAAAQRYHRGHTSVSVSIGGGYGYGYGPYYGYGYSPYDYGYA